MTRFLLPTGRHLPLTESADWPHHQEEGSEESLLRGLCKRMIAAQHRETRILEAIEDVLETRHSGCSASSPTNGSTPPHIVDMDCHRSSRSSFSTPYSPSPKIPALTASQETGSSHGHSVDARRVWCSERRVRSSASPQSGGDDAITLRAEVSQLRLQNAWYAARVEQLEKDMQDMKLLLRGASASVDHHFTPPTQRSNVLLHDSTHRLLAEAEALCGQHHEGFSCDTSKFPSVLQ